MDRPKHEDRPYNWAMQTLHRVIRRERDETDKEFRDRSHLILMAMAAFHPAAAVYFLNVVGRPPMTVYHFHVLFCFYRTGSNSFFDCDCL